jgi:hypothetical protein
MSRGTQENVTASTMGTSIVEHVACADDLTVAAAAFDANQREPARPVIPIAGQQADADGVPTDHEPISVVIDLVNPAGAGRRAIGGRGQARFDEAGGGRAGTRQHGWEIAGRRRGVESVNEPSRLRRAWRWMRATG